MQNTVDVRDVGSTSATITFFRSLGGAVGVAVLGAILANHVAGNITSGLTAAGLPSAGTGSSGSLDIKDLPAPIQSIVHVAYGDSFGLLFAIAAVISVVTLVAVVLVREVPLRTTVGITTPTTTAAADGNAEAVAEDVPALQAPAAGAVARRIAAEDAGEELSAAALDVLTVAQEQARQLLLESQRTADRLTRLARLEAERVLTEADAELAERQERIRLLKATEADLTERVGEKILQG